MTTIREALTLLSALVVVTLLDVSVAVAADKYDYPSRQQEEDSFLHVPDNPPPSLMPPRAAGTGDVPAPSHRPPAYRDFGGGILSRGGNIPDTYGTVIGPGGIVKPMPAPHRRAEAPKKKVLTPQERADAIRKALAPKPPLAFVRRHTLDTLYAKLAAASDEDEAKGLATLIANIWMRSGSDTANVLMQRVGQSVDKKDYAVALSLLDKIVELQPNWPEGWNKRAAVRFAAGDLDGSMADVEHVLRLEPKHFGALEGMAMILQRTGLDKQALEVYRRALAVYPHQPNIQETVDKLTLHVEGQGI